VRPGQQRFDELIEVIDLFQLAPGVLVQLAVAGQNMQFLEQFETRWRVIAKPPEMLKFRWCILQFDPLLC
jgi:hypothetical protein